MRLTDYVSPRFLAPQIWSSASRSLEFPNLVRMQGTEKDSNSKVWKKKAAASKVPMSQLEGDDILECHQVKTHQHAKTGQKVAKRNSRNVLSPLFQQPERSNSDSLPESSSDNNYRALRRKYLLLEEESFNLGKELKEVEDEVKTLEDEKLQLLDKLVVIEGLVDPSKM